MEERILEIRREGGRHETLEWDRGKVKKVERYTVAIRWHVGDTGGA